jgi:hypothetical protein
MKLFQILIVLTGILLACNTNPYKATNRVYKKQVKAFARELRRQPAPAVNGASYWAGTTNFNLRKPNLVVIHHTAQANCSQTLQTFTLPRTQVSAHYVICKDGTVHHMLNDYLRAWHGGVGKWGNNSDVNSASIGIELDNNGFEGFTEPQIEQPASIAGYAETKIQHTTRQLYRPCRCGAYAQNRSERAVSMESACRKGLWIVVRRYHECSGAGAFRCPAGAAHYRV